MKRPYILICNDDGINAPGIKHLYNAIKPYADCIIVAPSTGKSGAGLSTTLTKPLHIKEVSWDDNCKAYSVSGTPSDCIKLAVHSILEKKPDLVLSGINQGSNSGRNILYSGTIGAVIEAMYNDIPGIAFSCFDIKKPDFSKTEKYIYPIVKYAIENPLDAGCFFNVNFPNDTFESFKGIKIALQGKSYMKENPDRRTHPEGHFYYWIGGKWYNDIKEDERSDIHLLNHGYITISPLKIDQLACPLHYEKHKEKVEKLFEIFS